MSRLLIGLWLVCLIFGAADSFNLHAGDRSNVISGTFDSWFGYSLSVHQYTKKWLIVGAPRAQTTSVERPTGAAFRCELGATFNCSRLTVPAVVDEGSWLGATVASQEDKTLICAPRWGDYIKGRCYFGKENLQSLSPLNLQSVNYCGGGFSAVISKAHDNIFTGGPTCSNNDGHVYRNYLSTLQPSGGYTSQGSSYLAYSMAAGWVSSGVEALVASQVFQRNTLGKIYVYDPGNGGSLSVLASMEGFQSGEFFGGAVAMTDVNGDSLDELLIGAPHYSDYENPDILFEIGAVYVFPQTPQGRFDRYDTKKVTLLGRSVQGRFGSAIAALGDINQDGFKDVAIGAPYEKLTSGSVYIYLGSAAGLRNRPGQIISGSQFTPPLPTFGFSLAGNVDFDGNRYPDLFVGAYEADSVVYLPARPTVRLTGPSLNFKPNVISLDDKKCTTTKNVNVPCSELTFCLAYDGLNVAQSLSVNVSIVLDVQQSKNVRLLFQSTNENRRWEVVPLTRGQSTCRTQVTYIKADIRDKQSPMEAELTVDLVPSSAKLPPVLELYWPKSTSSSINILKNCGSDNLCIPDLKLTLQQSATKVIQGSPENLVIDVSIKNDGDDAFESEFFMHLPATINYVRMDRDQDAFILCSPPGGENGPALRCEVGNPLAAGRQVGLRLYLEPKADVHSKDRRISFLCQTNSTNAELPSTLADNEQLLQLDLDINTTLSISGQTRPEELNVNYTLLSSEDGRKNETQIPFVQFYEIGSKGPSEILAANATIFFITRSVEGHEICSSPQVEIEKGDAKCQLQEFKDSQFTMITCHVKRVSRAEPVVVKLSSRLYAEIITKYDAHELAVSSNFSVVVTELPFGIDPQQVGSASALVALKIVRLKSDSILASTEWWVYAASAASALIVLLATTAILYKCGFFKRNRPQDMAELQNNKGREEVDESDDNL